ncbi:aminoglycoside 6'-N-acetyltransferase [Nocardia seriolae]|uniref:Aminoglycoside N(6')-acetyltransferase type 1 n=1 Tax=Nocardia seriolae TaxID=37332 RepID=A0A0B8NF05_9NOCA|nr:aminoglycoside 6'-N-acetyltransferase [Nocardia seriolae]APB01230.1 Aminoglycoside 6'-N-acetyltransferase [Nocardia seriolae]MTJ61267.1 GNAT family N-acetyltransferase [Nocardia seriolae]MTJ70024.1 GNAT family N-acetyltransferase [Nocardia seriolae]MTJ90608.1 GNAT family N-acetyltransferase [Nocardia seriolae]MTK34569.1 GNAT family N-acetyltransferase [Nocardia seriolae]
MDTRIERVTADAIDAAAALRYALWPTLDEAGHRAELAEQVADPEAVILVARTEDGEPVGYAEASIRHDYVNGCDTSPVAFLEGIFVAPGHRLHGLSGALCGAVEEWGRSVGCTELGSDALLANAVAHRFHQANGFEERERVVYYRKKL